MRRPLVFAAMCGLCACGSPQAVATSDDPSKLSAELEARANEIEARADEAAAAAEQEAAAELAQLAGQEQAMESETTGDAEADDAG